MIGDSLRRLNPMLLTLSVLVGTAMTTLGLSVTAVASGSETTYLPQAPALDAVSGGPWNTSQGDPSAGAEYQLSDLLPSFTPGGSTTTIGGVTEPNLSVYPSATGATPYPVEWRAHRALCRATARASGPTQRRAPR